MNRLPHFLLLCVHGMIPVGLISFQGDDGTALVFLFIFVVMLIVAGLSWKYILLGCAAVPPAIYFIWNYVMQPHHKARVLILFDPVMQEQYPDRWYQQHWGRIALGSGKMTGVGLFGGDYVYTAYIHNDFIYAYIGNALGFGVCLGTIALLIMICM